MSCAPLSDRLRQHIAGQRPALRAGIAAAIVAALAAVVLMGVSGWFLTGAALAGAAGPAAARGFNYLVPSALIRLTAILRTGGRYLERLFSHRAALRALAGLRADLVALLVAQDPRRSGRSGAGDLAARLTADVDALENSVVRQPAMPAAVAAACAATAAAAFAGPGPALVAAGGLMLLPFLAGRLAARLTDRHQAEALRLAGDYKAEVAEQLSASAEIAAYGLAPQVGAALAAAAARMDEARRRAARGEAVVNGLLVAAGPLLAALVALSASGPAPAIAMAMLAVAAAAETLAGVIRARIADAGIRESLARLEQLDALPAEDAPGAPEVTGASLVIAGTALAPGARLALVGRSGSGKTRILETLAGLRDDAPQPLLLDGRDVRALPFETLRRTFALAPQDPLLIAGTLADNLRLARAGLEEAELWQALETACLDEMVRALPHGLDSWIGEGAERLSGGQRKRLALARALLAGRPWLLLDEPSEGLDPATEALLVQRLSTWLDRTGTGLVLSTHRPALLALAQGRIDPGQLILKT